jgi:hypothetical protein
MTYTVDPRRCVGVAIENIREIGFEAEPDLARYGRDREHVVD